MITLKDVLASPERSGEVSIHGLQEEEAARHRPSVYQRYFEEQKREGARSDKSPLVLWARRNLPAKAKVPVPATAIDSAARRREVA